MGQIHKTNFILINEMIRVKYNIK